MRADSADAPLIVTRGQLEALSTALGGGPVAEGVQRVSRNRGSALSDKGPEVTLVSPAQGTPAVPPLEIQLAFRARRAPVDLGTLHVWYVLKKGELEFEVDVTEQARPHFTTLGARLWIPEAAPKGVHVIRLAISDGAGGSTERRFALEVL